MKTKFIFFLPLFFIFSIINAQQSSIDLKKSSIHWIGEKLTGQHDGNISISSGMLNLKNNQIVSGEFTIDMTSITCTDIDNPQSNKKFIDHLKSDDFFGVNLFPEAQLVIKKSTKIDENNSKIDASLTIKDITHPISFIVKKSDNYFSSDIVVDRSKYNVRYRSNSFFENLGDKVIYDEFKLNVRIFLKPAKG